MSKRDDKREARAARREELSGAGPVREERAPARFPGATAKFALFGEVLLTGLLVALVGILVITLPAGLAAGMRHLRRYINAEGSPLSAFWRDVVRAMPGGAVIGAVAAVLAGILSFDIVLANSGALPGGVIVAGVGWIGVAALGGALLIAASLWSPETGWRTAVRATPAAAASDPVAATYIVVAAVMTGVVTWMLAPLIVPALGCATLAAIAAPHRRGR